MYKLSINLNRIPDAYKVLEDFEKARLYHAKHGVNLEFHFTKADVHGYTSSVYTHSNGFKQNILTGADKLIIKDPTAEIDMFVFDMAEWATAPGSPYPLKPETPNGSCFPINGKPFICIGTYPTEHANGQTWIQIAHEIMHALVILAGQKGITVNDVMDSYFHNDNPDYPNGNFAQQWELLKPFLNQPVTYKYFKLTESTGTGGHTFAELNPELRQLLDKMRDECGFPFVINSGYRTVAQNASLSDAVGDSAHLSGLAVDIACNDSFKRDKLLNVAKANGIVRRGIAKTFIHIDISKTLPQGVIWLYN